MNYDWTNFKATLKRFKDTVKEGLFPPVFSFSKLILASGIAVWMNTYLEYALRAADNKQAEKLKLENQLSEAHPGYSSCMRTMYNWQHKYGEKYAEEFVRQADLSDPNQLKNLELEEVNRCRSLCKDYWRKVLHLVTEFEVTNNEEFKEYKARHKRFKRIVQPLDKLDHYEEEPTYVYEFPDQPPQPSNK
jgi:hypothetical protein